MSRNVSVNRNAILSGIKCCQTSIDRLNSSARTLESKYDIAGNGWSDNQYRALGVIVHDCSKSLINPVSELESCIAKLRSILQAIDDYENINL